MRTKSVPLRVLQIQGMVETETAPYNFNRQAILTLARAASTYVDDILKEAEVVAAVEQREIKQGDVTLAARITRG